MSIERQTERERLGMERQKRESKKSENMVERERERARIKMGKMGQLRDNKIIEKIDYLNKRGDRINELMWVFCKSNGVKQKKQVFCVKQTESFK